MQRFIREDGKFDIKAFKGTDLYGQPKEDVAKELDLDTLAAARDLALAHNDQAAADIFQAEIDSR